MNIQIKELAEKQSYIEALLKPKLEKSLDNLLGKYQSIMAEHHIQYKSELVILMEQACQEGNSLIIQPEYCGYLVMVWKG